MAVYAWRGINAAGREVKGLDDADSPKALRALLKRQGVLVTKLDLESEKRKAEVHADVDKRVSKLKEKLHVS